jgi:hypothetical protein
MTSHPRITSAEIERALAALPPRPNLTAPKGRRVALVPAPPPPQERDVVSAIVEAVEVMGHIAIINGVAPGVLHRRGLGDGSPDVLVLLRPFWAALFLEAKRDEKQKLRPSQVKWHAWAKARGLEVEIVWNVPMTVRIVKASEARMHATAAKLLARTGT